MRFGKKLHYTLKYLVLGLPILLMLGLIFARNTEYYTFLSTFGEELTTTLDEMAGWYGQIASYINVSLDNLSPQLALLMFYPVYIFYVYLIDLLVDVITFVPKFFHELMNRDYIK